MIISWYGDGCFKIQNGSKIILTDIPTKESGISAPRVKADILLKSISPWPIKEEKFGGFVSYGAGEYDINGIKIQGFQISNESYKSFFKTIYVINWDDILIGFLGMISKVPEPKALENFEDVDVLIAPAGEEPFIPQKEVVRLVRQLNPKIFMPSFYQTKSSKSKLKDIDSILKEFDGNSQKDLDKFVFNKKELKEIKKTRVICLKA